MGASNAVDAFLPGALNEVVLDRVQSEPGLGEAEAGDDGVGVARTMGDGSANADGVRDATREQGLDGTVEPVLDVPDEVVDEILSYGERAVEQASEAGVTAGNAARSEKH